MAEKKKERGKRGRSKKQSPAFDVKELTEKGKTVREIPLSPGEGPCGGCDVRIGPSPRGFR